MLLIVGLGNPGAQYAGNRHNVGFMAVDAIHRRHGFGPWRRRFQAEVAEGTLAGDKVLLIRPQTYMNESGRSVGEAMRFYKLAPENVVVIHDEVDLPPGKTRMKVGGGTAGHNGLRSIGPAIGEEFRRLRIGVGKPDVKEMVPIHVLHDFTKADRKWVDPLLEAIAEHAAHLAENKDATFGNRLHEATGEAPARKAGPAKKADLNAKPSTSEGDDATPPPAAPAQEGALARGLKRLFGGKPG